MDYSVCLSVLETLSRHIFLLLCFQNRAQDEQNVNGHRGELNPNRQQEEPKEPTRGHPRPGSKPSIRPNAMKNRGKQLEALKLMEERIQRLQV